jgi:hypothetical protein
MWSDENLRRHTAAFPSLADLTCPEFDGLVGRLACAEADLRAGRLPMALLWLRVCPTDEVLGYFSFFNRNKRNGLAALRVPTRRMSSPAAAGPRPTAKSLERREAGRGSRMAARVVSRRPAITLEVLHCLSPGHAAGQGEPSNR